MNPHEEIRFSAQHGAHDTAPVVLLVLLVLTITATVAVVVSGTGLVIVSGTASGGVLTVAGARVLARRVRERREDARMRSRVPAGGPPSRTRTRARPRCRRPVSRARGS